MTYKIKVKVKWDSKKEKQLIFIVLNVLQLPYILSKVNLQYA